MKWCSLCSCFGYEFEGSPAVTSDTQYPHPDTVQHLRSSLCFKSPCGIASISEISHIKKQPTFVDGSVGAKRGTVLANRTLNYLLLFTCLQPEQLVEGDDPLWQLMSSLPYFLSVCFDHCLSVQSYWRSAELGIAIDFVCTRPSAKNSDPTVVPSHSSALWGHADLLSNLLK